MAQALTPTDPRRLGDYALLGRLGEGGMGTVFLGRAPDGRYVAVKIIRSEYAWDAEFRGRFRSEVNRAREVPTFCTAAVLDADLDHNPPYLVVEYVDGPSLAEVIRESGPLAGSTLQSVAVGVATALAAIHGAGVVHRDLKPQNVLFSLGSPKVIDFGVARAFEATSRHTRTDQMVGTVAYMAPERFDGNSDRAAGAAADVFAWGVVVAYAATGRTPFRGDSPVATAACILTQPPDLSGLDGPLRELVRRALAKEPADRPTAHELLDALLETGTGAFARRPELRRAAEAARRSQGHRVRSEAGAGKRRNRRLAVSVAAVAVLLLGGALVTALSRQRDVGASSFGKAPAPSAAAATAVRLTGGYTDPAFPYRLPAKFGLKAPVASLKAGNPSAFFEATNPQTESDTTVTVSSHEPTFTGPATVTTMQVRGHAAKLRTVYAQPASRLTLYWPESPARWIQVASDDTYSPSQLASLAEALTPASVAVLPPFQLDLFPAGFITDTVTESTISFRLAAGAPDIDTLTVELRKPHRLADANQTVGTYRASLTHPSGRGTHLDIDVTGWNAILEVTVGSGVTMREGDLLRFAAGIHILDRSVPA